MIARAHRCLQNERCKKQLQTYCVDTHDLMDCGAVSSFCESELTGPVWTSGRNPYDLSGECQLEDLLDSFCYPETKSVFDDTTDTYERECGH